MGNNHGCDEIVDKRGTEGPITIAATLLPNLFGTSLPGPNSLKRKFHELFQARERG